MNDQPPVKKREILGWCLYDFANSSFTTVIVTVVYGVYFTDVVARGTPGEAWWGRGYALSMLLVGILSPILGAAADFSGTKKRFLLFFTLLCIFSTALLFFVEEGDIFLGLGLFIVANVGYNGALTFYDAFLKEISTPKTMGRISGYGWSLGYLGGLLSLLLVYPLIKEGFNEENLSQVRISFAVVALFFFLSALPTFLLIREQAVARTLSSITFYMTVGFHRVTATLRKLRHYRELLKYFVSYLIYNDGINTVIVFAAIFAGGVLHFSPKELLLFFIVMQVSSAFGALLFGFVTDWIGPKRTISLTLILWIVIILFAGFVETKERFYLIGSVAGVALGSNQSASRTLLGLFAPRQQSAEFFGFFSLTGKVAATVGPLLYGELTRLFGQRPAVLSMSLFFLLGLILLQSVREEEGIRRATEVP